MTEEPVRNRRNKRVVEAARLHRARDRKAAARTLLEGPHVLAEALGTGVRVETLFALDDDLETTDLASRLDIELIHVDPQALKRLAGTETPRGPVGVVPIPGPQSIEGSRNLIVSWGVSDPGNVGTLIRTAAAFSWGFAYTAGTADPWSPKVLRAGAGAQFHVGPVSIDGPDDLLPTGLRIVASVVSGGQRPDELGPGPYALLVGEEAAGLPEDVSAGADSNVTIAMSDGFESLNAAVATGILVHELSKRSGDDPDGV
jgi:TrmH family RNA methyltransferase